MYIVYILFKSFKLIQSFSRATDGQRTTNEQQIWMTTENRRIIFKQKCDY